MVDFVCKPDVGQACHAAPEYLGAGVPVTVTSQMPAQLAQQAHRLIQTRGQRRRRLGAAHEGAQGFPLRIGEIDRAGHLRGLLSECGQMIDTPRHDQIDRQAIEQAMRLLQLPRFDPATALEDAVIDLDAPAARINNCAP